jgi:hypothetical protein
VTEITRKAGDLPLKIIRINRKDAEALESYVRERGSPS